MRDAQDIIPEALIHELGPVQSLDHRCVGLALAQGRGPTRLWKVPHIPGAAGSPRAREQR